MVHVLTASDRQAFKRCRRAWDFGSPLRQNLEPADLGPTVDLARAIGDALAVWYFPGMWEWDRSIVRPLAVEGYRRAVAGWPAGTEAVVGIGERLLDRYFEWSQTVDLFTPVRVETDFQVSIPDPADPLHDLVGAGDEAVHFAGRVDLLVVDELDRYWLVTHRTSDRWADVDELLLDERAASYCWAWERAFLGMNLAGTVHTELRTDVDVRSLAPVPPLGTTAPVAVAGHRRMYVRAGDVEGPAITREGDDAVRRTWIRRGLVEMERVRHKLGVEAREMTADRVAVYPTPAWDSCSACRFRSPCLALDTGEDVSELLATAYRPRPPATPEEGRLGTITWSIGRGAAPPTFRGDRRPDQ
ncbi:MAG TPA: PD-(D/E)XK nuclease family protein [Acidimicrobiales bacterium]|jgi:hypothetical protein|nr:PD-(D/E)XK nuclease family protein [Acidimicrobiales bacterium]